MMRLGHSVHLRHSAIGRATLLQAAQISLKANHLAQCSDLGNNGVETKVAGLFTVRDASYYEEKNMPCHGSYSKSSSTL